MWTFGLPLWVMLASRHFVRKYNKKIAKVANPWRVLYAYQVLQTALINIPPGYNAFELEVHLRLLRWLTKEIAALETLAKMNVVAVGTMPKETHD